MKEDEGIIVSNIDYQKLIALVSQNECENSELLEEELSRARIIEQEKVPADVVMMNSTVRFIDEDSLKESELTLVYPSEADVDKNRVSILAPIGIALLGLKVGQHIDWPVPSGKRRKLKVTSIVSQPKAEQDWSS